MRISDWSSDVCSSELNHQADRRAGGPALEHARKDSDPVRLLPLRGVARLARPPLVQPGLNLRLRQAEARRAAVHHRAQRGAVAFTPGREAKNAAEGVEAHSCVSSRANASAYSARPLSGDRKSTRLNSSH